MDVLYNSIQRQHDCVLQTMALFESSADLCVTATGPADKTVASTYKQELV